MRQPVGTRFVVALVLAELIFQVGLAPRISVSAAGSPVRYASLAVDPVSASGKPLDACLLDSWFITNYGNYMATRLRNLTVQGESGLAGINYKKIGTALTVAHHFTMSFVAKDTGSHWTVEIVGAGTADWTTPRKGVLKYTHTEGSFTETLTHDGNSTALTLPSLFGNPTEHYTCTKTVLKIRVGTAQQPVILSRSNPTKK